MARTCPTTNWSEDLPDIPDSVDVCAITRGCDEGKPDGVFDSLMEAHQCAIDKEFKKQRLTGPEYSKVYLGGMQTAMQQSIAFVMGKDKASAEAELARYAIVKTKADVELVNAQICLTKAQIEKMDADILLTRIQGWVELAKISTSIETVLARKDADGRMKDIDKVATDSLVGKSKLKTAEEINMLKQKVKTERAQIEDKLGNVEVQGLIQKNKNVLQRQADGFLRNAETAAAKVAVDAMSVQFSISDGIQPGELDPSFTVRGKDGKLGDMIDAMWNGLYDVDHASSDITSKRHYDATAP